jgi:hypothetical protein
MNPAPSSFFGQAQLALLRLLSIALGLIDRLFNVSWGEKLLERMSRHWQARLEEINRTLADLQAEQDRLQMQTEALAIHAATVYLAGRNLTQDGLRFDPALPRDEEVLDASIETLVKRRLAAIDSEEVEPGHFIYHLEPDWAAIHTRLSAAADQVEPEMAEWFREGMRLAAEALPAQEGTQNPPIASNPHQE